MYITMYEETVGVPNPYYSPGNRGIESEYTTETRTNVQIFMTEDSFKDYLSENQKLISKMRCFKAEEIFPKVVTTVSINL